MTKVIIHGHRGSRGTHPENTIPSFREAFLAGAPFVELDVHLTRDRKLVIHHDPRIPEKLRGNADGPAIGNPIPINALTLHEIQAFDSGIPSLEELILWKRCEAPSLRLNVEIKTGSADPERLASETIGLLEKYGLIAESLVQSFDREIVRAARQRSASLRLSCLFEEPADYASLATAFQAQVAAIHYPLINRQVVEECHRAGLEVLPWTVNAPQDLQRLLQLGIRSVITDYPRNFAVLNI